MGKEKLAQRGGWFETSPYDVRLRGKGGRGTGAHEGRPYGEGRGLGSVGNGGAPPGNGAGWVAVCASARRGGTPIP